ncbi:MFS transporter [Tuwongella immobilis]|nr:MFS transporter [Tuwongella immobilis]
MIFITMIVAVLLYLDRICLSTAGVSIQQDLKISEKELEWVLGSFFITYALAQLPAGWLGDRYGARWMLTAYLMLWSLCTGLSGIVTGLTGLLVLRLACGLFEAGAYPVAAGVVTRWTPLSGRGLASGIIAVGGRIGGAIAPALTGFLMIWWAGGAQSPELVTSWRPVMMLYGIVGIIVGVIFWAIYRDWPRQHPLVNEQEVTLIEGNHPPRMNRKSLELPPLRQMLTNRSLWANSFVQFSSNLGWAFLVTSLPLYLRDAHQTELQNAGLKQSIPLFMGIGGLLFGGILTDWITRRTGLRWSRSIPSILSRFIVGLGFLGCAFLQAEWQVLVMLAIIGFATDMATPSVWAYGQDVARNHVGAVVGWANMIGNFGAAASPIVMGEIRRSFHDPVTGWRMAFFSFAALQIAATVAAFWIDASKPLVPTTESPSTDSESKNPTP